MSVQCTERKLQEGPYFLGLDPDFETIYPVSKNLEDTIETVSGAAAKHWGFFLTQEARGSSEILLQKRCWLHKNFGTTSFPKEKIAKFITYLKKAIAEKLSEDTPYRAILLETSYAPKGLLMDALTHADITNPFANNNDSCLPIKATMDIRLLNDRKIFEVNFSLYTAAF
jgi:hypothetical protein